ncbi:threonylcarbamoyl-AMP synthase [Paracrocinitomix mangrovi]|uniref:L-threonylcarbamoyladenylate synthase n=1 Tax=Paracrocinitomix mangrovi TaxID=2862509 RepID=UPI001C8DADFD|nr:L-threonylcarbamoyladenylate synthase [Paracrocinitomix mangrovi]UKN02477.1 threonylcarbamoyl-AMP synthase [Paracrocinitomix mangrovi]
MIIEINEQNPDQRKIDQVVKILNKGGVIIYPTDTVYSFGCSIMHKRAIEKLAWLRGLKLKKANFSLICFDLSTLSEHVKFIDRPTYKVLNKNLPGPFTFILPASNKIPKLFDSNKKTVGIRIPDNNIAREIVRELGHPLVTTSLHDDDDIVEYTTDPYKIQERWESQVDAIVDGGFGKNEPSTVVDFSEGEVEIVRQGIGELIY